MIVDTNDFNLLFFREGLYAYLTRRRLYYPQVFQLGLEFIIELEKLYENDRIGYNIINVGDEDFQ